MFDFEYTSILEYSASFAFAAGGHDNNVCHHVNEGKKSLVFSMVKLSPEFINDHASESNLLHHLYLDANGIAYMDNDKLVGYVGYKGQWIVGIWVNPSYRSNGVGSKLLRYAVKNGAYRSSVNKQNIDSLNFHEKNGFIIYKFDTNMYFLKNEK